MVALDNSAGYKWGNHFGRLQTTDNRTTFWR